MSEDMDFKGVFIPASVWLHENLSWTARIILVQIFYLSKSGRGCFASNARLAEFVGLSEAYVRNLISKLTKEGYIVQTSKGKDRLMFVTCKTGLVGSQKCDPEGSVSHFCANTSQKSANTSHFCANTSQKSDHKYIENKEKKERVTGAYEVYREVFPNWQLDLFSRERLEAFDCDLDIWRETVVYWGTNSYSPRKIVEMMEVYDRKVAERAKESASDPAVVFCDRCRDTSGLMKQEGLWIKCMH